MDQNKDEMPERKPTPEEQICNKKGTAIAVIVASLETLGVLPADIGVIALIIQNSLQAREPKDARAIINIANGIQEYGTLTIRTDLTLDTKRMVKDEEDRKLNGDNTQKQDVRSDEG